MLRQFMRIKTKRSMGGERNRRKRITTLSFEEYMEGYKWNILVDDELLGKSGLGKEEVRH